MTTSASAETVALCLGSNAPDSELRLRAALTQLTGALTIERISHPYRTAAVSPIAQPDFLNAALVGSCALAPDELLALAKSLERAAGRRRGPRWGPRPLDVDLVLWGERQLHRPELALPHPRLRERAFFLIPLAEIAPDLPVPPDGATLAELAAELDAEGVVRLEWSDPPRRSG